MIRFIAWLTGGKAIRLRDFQGDEYSTIAWRSAFGWSGYVYWLTKVGGLTLNDDGTTGGSATYITEWRPL